jgi:hypothetical protein
MNFKQIGSKQGNAPASSIGAKISKAIGLVFEKALPLFDEAMPIAAVSEMSQYKTKNIPFTINKEQ